MIKSGVCVQCAGMSDADAVVVQPGATVPCWYDPSEDEEEPDWVVTDAEDTDRYADLWFVEPDERTTYSLWQMVLSWVVALGCCCCCWAAQD